MHKIATTVLLSSTALALLSAPAHADTVIYRAPYGTVDRIQNIPEVLTEETPTPTPAPMPTRHILPSWLFTGSAD